MKQARLKTVMDSIQLQRFLPVPPRNIRKQEIQLLMLSQQRLRAVLAFIAALRIIFQVTVEKLQTQVQDLIS